jgi:hypothetical protein
VRKCEEFMGDDNYGGVVFAAAVLVSLPCFLSCVYMVYECIFILWLWTCGKPAIGVLHSFTWPTRDGLTLLCCCNRAKWHPRTSHRPQSWLVVYRPLGGLPKSTVSDATGLGIRTVSDTSRVHQAQDVTPTKWDRCCLRDGYHLARIEMPAESSNQAARFDHVEMRTCASGCCVRADLAPSKDRFERCMCMFSSAIFLACFGLAACSIVWYFCDWNRDAFLMCVLWSIGAACFCFVICFACNICYLRFEQYPDRFFSHVPRRNILLSMLVGQADGESTGAEKTSVGR